MKQVVDNKIIVEVNFNNEISNEETNKNKVLNKTNIRLHNK